MLSRKPAKPLPTAPNSEAQSAEANAAKALLEERNAAIKRLETALAEERQNATLLREASDQLRFKADVLEKSYAKQLADARLKTAAAEKALADHQAKIAAFGEGREETMRLLTEARAELEKVKLDRDQLKRQHARGPNNFDRSPLARRDADATATEGTINQLMANADWAKEAKPRVPGSASVETKTEPAAPEIMLAPELVFTKKDKDDE